MNDRRFIELLNLYLDHQIKPAEAAELEAIVYSSPAHRRTYEEYCQLQRACVQLGSNARASAPIAPRFARSINVVERKITAPQRPNRWFPLQVGGLATLAMAAGFVLVIRTNSPDELAPVSVTQNQSYKALSETPVLVATLPLPTTPLTTNTTFALHPSLVSVGLGATQNADDLVVSAPDREAIEWMQRVDQLPLHTLVLDEQVFANRAMVPPDTHVFRRPRSLQPSAEFTGFQFSR